MQTPLKHPWAEPQREAINTMLFHDECRGKEKHLQVQSLTYPYLGPFSQLPTPEAFYNKKGKGFDFQYADDLSVSYLHLFDAFLSPNIIYIDYGK